ncbi:hypothetical protein [Spirillospora sp. NPDC048819]|uniref:hypothetical protein n=1 Tax=Spirillospora sp. NPDC048819 TaxID=3155268 RepID=UPI00340A041B
MPPRLRAPLLAMEAAWVKALCILSKRSARGRVHLIQAVALGRMAVPTPQPFRDHLIDYTVALILTTTDLAMPLHRRLH